MAGKFRGAAVLLALALVLSIFAGCHELNIAEERCSRSGVSQVAAAEEAIRLHRGSGKRHRALDHHGHWHVWHDRSNHRPFHQT